MSDQSHNGEKEEVQIEPNTTVHILVIRMAMASMKSLKSDNDVALQYQPVKK